MSRRSALWVLASLAVAAVTVYLPATMSSASFTAQTTNVHSHVAAAPDWVPPVVTMTNPGAVLRGTVTLAATASDPGGSGVDRVRFERAPRAGTVWTTTGTDATSPYSAPFDTRTVPNGPLDLRAVATDRAGFSTSTPAIGVTVDNSLVRGRDVQAFNGGELGRLDAGDVLELTYSHQMQTNSLLVGWNGTPRQVVVRTQPRIFTYDSIEVFTNTSLNTPVKLGVVDLNASYMSSLLGRALDRATMTAETRTIDGRPATVIRIVFGSRIEGGPTWLPVLVSTTLEWTPAAGPLDVFGIGMSTAMVAESGTRDRDF